MSRIPLAVLAAVFTASCLDAASASADVVLDWNVIALKTTAAAPFNPPLETRNVAIVHAASPLRSAAATLRELEGRPRLSARESLDQMVQELGDARFTDAVAQISTARESGVLPPDVPRQTVLALIELASALHERALKLPSHHESV